MAYQNELSELSYRTTPLEHGYSPSQLFMSRHLRSPVSVTQEQLKTITVIDLQNFKARDESIKQRQKRNFYRQYGVRLFPPLHVGTQVWIPDLQTKGILKNDAATRSYSVETAKDTLRLNWRHLNSLRERRIQEKRKLEGRKEEEKNENENNTEQRKSDETEPDKDYLIPCKLLLYIGSPV